MPEFSARIPFWKQGITIMKYLQSANLSYQTELGALYWNQNEHPSWNTTGGNSTMITSNLNRLNHRKPNSIYNTHTRARVHTHTRAQTRTHADIQTQTLEHTHTQTHTTLHTHTHTRAHAHTHYSRRLSTELQRRHTNNKKNVNTIYLSASVRLQSLCWQHTYKFIFSFLPLLFSFFLLVFESVTVLILAPVKDTESHKQVKHSKFFHTSLKHSSQNHKRKAVPDPTRNSKNNHQRKASVPKFLKLSCVLLKGVHRQHFVCFDS